MTPCRRLPGRRGAWVAVLAAACAVPAWASVSSFLDTYLWQEQSSWDALLSARDKAARQQADPNLVPMVRGLAQQAAQQTANLQQIQGYAKSQQDNLRFAYSQRDPEQSLRTIRQNLDTLSQGTGQVRNNLNYLTARCRMAATQALPDAELAKETTVVIAQIQAAQLQLNALYTDAAAVQAQVSAEHEWLRDDFLRFRSDDLVRSAVSVQDGIYSIYNAAYDMHLRSK